MAEISECVIVELLFVVRDEDPGDSEEVNDAFSNKSLDILFHDSGQWFFLNQFDEIVDPYNEELELSYCNGEGSYYVQSSLNKRPGGAHWCKFLSWLSYDVVEALALVTCFYVGLGILLYSESIVLSPYQLVNL